MNPDIEPLTIRIARELAQLLAEAEAILIEAAS